MNENTSNAPVNEEEYLKKHLSELENKNKGKETNASPITVTIDNSNVKDLHYFNFDTKDFPCSLFYPAGTKIKIRAAQVKEIQAYSMVDDNNFYDIIEKMNDMLSSCIRVVFPDNKMGTYLDIKDPDRYFLIFVIRELTFQQGTNLVVNANCIDGQSIQIEFKRENFRFFDVSDKIKDYYNPSLRCFSFETINGQLYNLAPPTIGLQKSFTEYIIKENAEKKKPNLAFLKIIPFVLHDKNSISIDGIKSKLDEFEKIDNQSFQFLNSAVDKLTFGIKELVKRCPSCGEEVRSDMLFPNGPSAIFVVHDAFDQYIKK